MNKLIINNVKKIRSFLFTYLAKQTCNNFVSIKANGYTRLTNKTMCGKNVNFNGCIVYGKGKVSIGDNFHSGKGVKMITQVHNYNGNSIPYDNTYIIKDILIEDNVWLGMDVTILGGVKIGEGVIVQAGSVVVADLPKYSIVGGHPAKVFSERSIIHYNECKINKKFH
jgi:chloramphenicol O-acetyltransferase type B